MSENNGKEIKLGSVLPFNLRDLTAPVHVAVICPPQAAVTLLLNKMAKHNASFVLMQSLPMQVGAVSLVNGQPNIQIYPLLIFSMQQKEFETWMKCAYEEVCMYQMEDILNDRILMGPRK